MKSYNIAARDEETECTYCGAPLYLGDTVYTDDDERDAFCSEQCALLASEFRSFAKKEGTPK